MTMLVLVFSSYSTGTSPEVEPSETVEICSVSFFGLGFL